MNPSQRIQEEILALIRASVDGMTRDEIAEEINVEEDRVQRALRSLERAKLIEKAPELRTTREMVYVITRSGS